MNANTWNKLIAPVRRRIQLMISRAVGRMVDPSVMLQTLQLEILKGEVVDNVEHFEGYGRTAHPPAGYEALTASLGGDRAHTVAIAAVHRQFRVRDLAEGEQALYDDLGNVIHFKRDRILINAVDLVEVIAPACHIQAITTHDGNVTINGNLVVSGTANVAGMTTVGGLASTGVAGASTVTGDLTLTGGDITVDGISSKTHVHQETGTITGAPQ